jgi:hypothetical protein
MADLAIPQPQARRGASVWVRLKANRNWLGAWFMLPAAAFLGFERHVPVPGDSEQPASECPLRGVKPPDPACGRNEYLLGRFLRDFSPAQGQRQTEPVHGVEMHLEQLPPSRLAAALSGDYDDCLSVPTHPPIASCSHTIRILFLLWILSARPESVRNLTEFTTNSTRHTTGM